MSGKRLFRFSARTLLYSCFLGLIIVGTFLLSLDISWDGTGVSDHVSPVDAFFTSVSATCVTGLITVDTSLWSRFGQMVILVLIQIGGLGIITFGMFYLVIPNIRISLRNNTILHGSYYAAPFTQGRKIIKNILGTTLLIELIGAILLTQGFLRAGTREPVFEGIFHSISAFCNAGFSLFPDGIVPFRSNLLVNFTLMGLVLIGGTGFLVIRDLRRKFQDWKRPLLFHTRIMLLAAPSLILIGFLGYLLMDTTSVFSALSGRERYLAALFQSVTTRTAGFNTIDQASLSLTSRWMTLVLMLIGGGSGSTAGGIKVTTAFILFIVLFHGVNERGDIRFLNRRIASADVSRATMFFLKAFSLLFCSILLLGILEQSNPNGLTASEIIFECVSALGTVGLSMNITQELTTGGKILIIATMFAGRVGLFSLVIRTVRDRTETLVEYPKGEVLIG